MVVSIFLISSNNIINDFFQKKRSALIPINFKKNKFGVSNPEYRFYVYDPTTHDENLEDFLLSKTKESGAAVLLVEDKLEASIKNIKVAFFFTVISFTDGQKSLQNYFSKIFSRLLKNFSILILTMSSSDNEQAMLLPVRNFKADQLKNLIEICKQGTMSSKFTNSLQVSLTKLKKMKQPRRDNNYKTTYFVDYEGKYFEYGKEKHARFPTGDPHYNYCNINGIFRFGKRIAIDRHFNVSKLLKGKTRIDGQFLNCHDEKILVQGRTHINMFSNDSH